MEERGAVKPPSQDFLPLVLLALLPLALLALELLDPRLPTLLSFLPLPGFRGLLPTSLLRFSLNELAVLLLAQPLSFPIVNHDYGCGFKCARRTSCNQALITV